MMARGNASDFNRQPSSNGIVTFKMEGLCVQSKQLEALVCVLYFSCRDEYRDVGM